MLTLSHHGTTAIWGATAVPAGNARNSTKDEQPALISKVLCMCTSRAALTGKAEAVWSVNFVRRAAELRDAWG